MARMRSLKPEFWLDRKLARSLSRDARMLYLALWNQADEWARAQADPRLIKGQTFPYDDDISLARVDQLMDALAGAGVLQRYEVDGDPYLFLPKLAKHQRLEPSKVPSRFPAPPPFEPDQQVYAALQVRANESARDSDGSAPRANELPLKHVAGSREHVAGQPPADKSTPRASLRAVAEIDSANQVMGLWLESLTRRPPSAVVGQIAKQVKTLLADKFTPQEIIDGLNAWQAKGLHPSTLPSVVNETVNKPKRPTYTDEVRQPVSAFSAVAKP